MLCAGSRDITPRNGAERALTSIRMLAGLFFSSLAVPILHPVSEVTFVKKRIHEREVLALEMLGSSLN